jgi:hypothetical protein
MTSMTIIPGLLCRPLREGAYEVSRGVAEAIDHGVELFVCRERLMGVLRLLDVMGWRDDDPAKDTEIDLGVHAATLRAVVDVMLPTLREAEGEREAYEALRGFAVELPGALLRLEVPAEVVALLRGALYAELGRAATEFDAECTDRVHERVVESLTWFDRLRALMDEIGWRESDQEQHLVLDPGLYSGTVRKVLESELAIQLDLVEDSHDPGEHQRATESAVLVERFLTQLEAAS